jgi:hypothetical protein
MRKECGMGSSDVEVDVEVEGLEIPGKLLSLADEV